MPVAARARSPLQAGRRALAGSLPARYERRFEQPFWDRVAPALVEGVRVLDLGAGRTPVIPPEWRPQGCRYVGLDISSAELQLAPAGAYDEILIADAAGPLPAAAGSFDLIVSWHVLEHLKPLPVVLANIAELLTSGGRLVAHFAGGFSAHALLNRVLPSRLGSYAMERLLGRPEESVFEAQYDRCYYTALVADLAGLFPRTEVVPIYRDAWYFGFNRWAEALYITYEEWAAANEHRNLASHYVLSAER